MARAILGNRSLVPGTRVRFKRISAANADPTQSERRAIRELIGLQGPKEAFAVPPHSEPESVRWVFSDIHDGYANRWTMDSSVRR
ncbi:hypothetical protein CEXT_89591 [Caerostris extrusa]|uniref:Uncharacterized protein n=1 Tax=Caerostris extrusa TaxID=172846 RepID=A0AAV4YD40_CAEEX|nr:hypothetical protein CEXT_89591 [Caerostris extrusa]